MDIFFHDGKPIEIQFNEKNVAFEWFRNIPWNFNSLQNVH